MTILFNNHTDTNVIILFCMKIVKSMKNIKKRDKNNQMVRRKGRIYIINKVNPRMKAKQA